MDYSAKILGLTTVRHLRERAAAPVLRIGSDAFDRAALSGVACFNFQAAANLSRAVLDLGVKNARDLFDNIPPESLALPRLGSVSLAVLGSAFEAKRIGGDNPLESWMAKHHPAGAPLVTFDTLKHRDAAEHAAERKATKARRAQRRDTAHTIRKSRFHKRRASAAGSDHA